MRVYKFPIDTYNCFLYFKVTSNVEKEVNKLRRKYGLKPLQGPFAGMADEYELTHYYVIVGEEHLNYNTICHEIFHTVHTITEDRDIKDEEAQAWLCGYISQKIFGYLASKKIKINTGS